MSDTPRTRKAECHISEYRGSGFIVDSDFARELERENAALRKRLELLSKADGKQTDECQCCNNTRIIRCLGRDNDEIIEDCPKCAAIDAAREFGHETDFVTKEQP